MPNGWCFIKIKNIASLYNGDSINQDIKKAKYTNIDEGFNYIGTKDIGYDNQINYENGVKIPFKEPFKVCPKGKVLLCIEGGNAGNKIAISEENVCFGNKLLCFNTFSFEDTFLFIYLQSTIFRNVFKSKETGLIGGVSIPKIGDCYIPIPSQNEQLKIVKIVKVFLDKINSINRLFVDVENLKLKIKSRIITLGVQGKLLNTDDNYYYEKMLSDVAKITMGQSIKSEEMDTIDTPNSLEFHQGKTYFTQKTISSSNIYTKHAKKTAEPNSILFSVRAPVGAINYCDRQIAIGRGLAAITPQKYLSIDYLYFLLFDCSKNLIENSTGTTFDAIKKEQLFNLKIKIPPYPIQERIISIINKCLIALLVM